MAAWRRLLLASAVLVAAAGLGICIAEGRWLLVLLFVAAPVALLWPVEVSLGALGFVIPFESVFVLKGSESAFSITFLVSAAGSLMLLWHALVTGALDLPPRAAAWWSAMVAWAALSVAWAIEPDLVLNYLPSVLALIGLYLVAVSVRVNEQQISTVLLFAIAGAVVASVYSGYQYHMGVEVAERASLASGGNVTNPNMLAFRLLPGFAFATTKWLSPRAGMNWTMAACSGVILIGILLTMSRGSLVAIAFMGVLLMRRLHVGWKIIVLGLIGLCVVAVLPSMFVDRLEEALPSGGAGRLYVWRVGLVALTHYGLLGAGLDNFPAAYSRYSGLASVFWGYARAAHESYLGLAVELGVVGVIAYVRAVGLQFRTAWDLQRSQIRPTLLACEMSCWALLVAGLFSDGIWAKASWFSWLLLAMAARAASITDSAGASATP